MWLGWYHRYVLEESVSIKLLIRYSKACGPTHTAVTPLDLVKCRRQVDSNLYKSNLQAWKTITKAEGLRGVFTGS